MIERNFHIMTFGCQMNSNDSDWLKRSLISRGFTEAATPEDASVFILNTCSVREKPEQKVYSLLGRIQTMTKGREDILVAVGGCVAQQVGRGFFNRFKQVRLVFGTDGLASAPQALDRLVEEDQLRMSLLDFSEEYPEKDQEWSDGVVPPAGFVNIMQGCDNFCAYCIVPYTRGRQKSRSSVSVLEECSTLVARGMRDITLLGQNVNSFGQDAHGDGTSFAALLHQVADIKGLERLRFVTSHPKDIADEVIDAFGTRENICPRLHLPMQSGSDRILKSMGRKYDITRYRGIVDKLRHARPDLQLTTDIIVGFPGETEEDFLQTLRTAQEIGFAQSFSFNYSDRPGTRAEMLADKVTKEVMQDRLQRYQDWQSEYTEHILQSMVGRKLDVLFEGMSKKPGSDNNAEAWQGRDVFGQLVHVTLPSGGDMAGKFMPVTITEAKKHSLIGEKAGEPW
ncbi:tRNA (N6-isopentenyl adenosine(37)-C2)-methylthiotransferase MiaB [Desulfovibrio subterraneus]|uniref:tRNA (N6-isopentenyl adenosine(37)-C2)-methylthiotransferase MiaB n=1 Tax=Desulfovibrio subterraneus TaxID=2718620 RepID=UPI0022B886C9|nr:tRNA (N6-isopentenyl adenosine(37)-C2)-methylthiotransferase MiaB [Desulfovibrio subterraneus]WBF68473.1 tRNA (N6-isopentenyl adenosine(37)-C2)-methylthiotransferase MiaB [Desulfovibrio subterraneus]